jgi:hypothetical protein
MVRKPEAEIPVSLNLQLPALAEKSGQNLFPQPPRSGDPCPMCKKGRLDYDGLLNLSCLECGFALAGCFT